MAKRRMGGMRLVGLRLLALAFTVAGGSALLTRPASAQTAVTSAESEWLQDLDTWRARRAQEVDAPDGWLTLVALEWLKPGTNSVGAAPDNRIQVRAQVPAHIGLLTLSGKTLQLLSPSGGFPADLKIDGQPAREGPLPAGAKPALISWHGLSMVVLDRGGRYAVRIKDADSATRAGFHGLNWYAPDPQFSVEARWVPFTSPHIERIPTAIGTTLDLPAPGTAEFTVAGHKLTLEPVLERPGDQMLLFILEDKTGKEDETGKQATYAGGRYLHAPFPDHGLDKPGKLILDFNRLENPACAYTPYATCPQPPEKNRLPVAIEAGEKRYAP